MWWCVDTQNSLNKIPKLSHQYLWRTCSTSVSILSHTTVIYIFDSHISTCSNLKRILLLHSSALLLVIQTGRDNSMAVGIKAQLYGLCTLLAGIAGVVIIQTISELWSEAAQRAALNAHFNASLGPSPAGSEVLGLGGTAAPTVAMEYICHMLISRHNNKKCMRQAAAIIKCAE